MTNLEPKECLCDNCRDMRPVTTRVDNVVEQRKGVSFTVEHVYVLCEVCGAELYDPAIHDQNIDNYKNAYRKAKSN